MRTLLRVLSCLFLLSGSMGATLAPMRSAEAGQPKRVKNEPYSAEFRALVNSTIRKGIDYLREKQMSGPSGLGAGFDFEEAAAVLWVLRRAGVELDERQAEHDFRILRAHRPDAVSQASLLILALCAEPLPDGDPFAIEAGAQEKSPPALSEADAELVRQTVAQLLDEQEMEDLLPPGLRGRLPPDLQVSDNRGGWGRQMGVTPRVHLADVPNTYLALLALEAASRRGIVVPTERFLAALELLLRWQAPRGPRTTLRLDEVREDERLEWSVKAHSRGYGWTGGLSGEPSGFETAGAAVALTICRDALQGSAGFTRELRGKTETALVDALAWIQRHYTIRENPDPHDRSDVDTAELYHHHWLQALARLAIHLRLRHVDKHDWYQEGAELLVKQQKPDGSWEAIWWSNCYALLFLQRASLRAISPVITSSER